MKLPYFFGASLLVLASVASAVTLSPTSYDMPNGDGQVNGGDFNYWDLGYTGIGSTNTDDAALSGGLGDLTDGTTTTDNWFDAENSAGTGPYVGWVSSVQPDVVITFNFTGAVNIHTVRIHADDTDGEGGVNLPASAMFTWANGGTATFPITDPDPGSTAPSWLEFSGLGATGVPSLTVELEYSNLWIFVDEVEFIGVPVPEPSTYALMALGLAGLINRVRHRRA